MKNEEKNAGGWFKEKFWTRDLDTIKNWAWVLMGISICIALIGSCVGGASDEEYSRTCGSCNRSFSDSGNRRSITRTGMCKNCYANFSITPKMGNKDYDDIYLINDETYLIVY